MRPVSAPRPTAALATFAACVCSAHATADVVVVASGAALRGEVVAQASPSDGKSADGTVVRTPHGELVLPADAVRATAKESPAEAEYRSRAPSVSDTLEAQLALALWCRDNGVGDGMRRHLTRVIELDPDHAEARALLGYQRQDGRWTTRDGLLASRGLVRWEGSFRTQQEVELLQRQAHADAARTAWRKTLAAWRQDLESPDRDAVRKASEALDSLDDPQAAGELLALLAAHDNPAVRQRLARAAGRLGTPACLNALARIALNDSDPELRAIALEQLAADGRPGLASPFVAALRSKDNAVVNHAGDGLATLGGRSALDPLITALVTTHRRKVGNDSGGDTYSLNSASGTFGFGGGGPKVVRADVQNPRVLAALVHLTGVNHLYDQAAWRQWLAAQQTQAPVDLRRDL